MALVVRCWWLFDDCCVVCAVCGLLFVGGVCCLLSAAWRRVFVVWCVVFGGWCLVSVDCCVLVVVCCLLFVVCVVCGVLCVGRC